MDTGKLKDVVQDCHLNFLMGSGLSMPYLRTLGNVEVLLTALDADKVISREQKAIVRCSILSTFFTEVLFKNQKVIARSSGDVTLDDVLQNYATFLSTLTSILLKRKSTILNKQVNLFTTNVDVFLERALEDEQLEVNDGFSGRIRPTYSVANFSKTVFKNSLHFNNSAELPVFNLIKLHGSLTWKVEGDKIHYSDLNRLSTIQSALGGLAGNLVDVPDTSTLSDLKASASRLTHNAAHDAFLSEYEQLAIVNPTKDKFRDTIMNLNYYEMLRVFSNELEKENSVLFVLGFSVADEHIREILIRAANANPTLLVVIYCYDASAKSVIDQNLAKSNVGRKYNNVLLLAPSPGTSYDFKGLNSTVFQELLSEINKA